MPWILLGGIGLVELTVMNFAPIKQFSYPENSAVIIMIILPDIVYKDKVDAAGQVIIDAVTNKPVQEFLGAFLLPVSVVMSLFA